MNKEDYELVVRLQNAIPPTQETPEGQKFHIGEIVKISNPESWFSEMSHAEDQDRLFEVQYSYNQKYRQGQDGRNSTGSYSLKHLFEDNSSAWYDAEELELVKGIDEITEEKERAELIRLKKKYKS